MIEEGFAGIVSVDLKTGSYNVAIEGHPDPISEAEAKFHRLIEEAERRGQTVGAIASAHDSLLQPPFLKEVMIIEDLNRVSWGFISTKYIENIEPWEDQIRRQMCAYELMNGAGSGAKEESGSNNQKSTNDYLLGLMVAIIWVFAAFLFLA